MGRIFTIEDVKRILDETGKKAGFPCNGIPVEISVRMKKTYGSFVFKAVGNKIIPVAFKFSEKLLSGDYPDEIVINTIKHEYAHYYANVTTGVNHMHDTYFKEVCRRLGIPEDTRFQGEHRETVRNGYKILCTKCMNEVARRRRSDSTKALLTRFRSGCCNARLMAKREKY
ncbi:MAG: SprT-like domain-containing protein [Clostridiaceae bacterium]